MVVVYNEKKGRCMSDEEKLTLFVHKDLDKKIKENHLLVNDRINELLERIVVIEKELRDE